MQARQSRRGFLRRLKTLVLAALVFVIAYRLALALAASILKGAIAAAMLVSILAAAAVVIAVVMLLRRGR
ncbi:hypothetical protein APE_0708a [Aeropyrum pernix K1]|uniref:Uncharacterized protein n=1 Tax=Aeropyrum pernix (strain ATCC 700893 / DSM 11879 / JCM 9820 / NBRC 100138 / K1) TaxID=272557 RepID=Q05E59_AERPE|nr:hypothetical protein [Aeropyrum pernix]BAF34742.1 hypothetical protein APE_0708a [Aeropyrum pernix K1]